MRSLRKMVDNMVNSDNSNKDFFFFLVLPRNHMMINIANFIINNDDGCGHADDIENIRALFHQHEIGLEST